MQPGDSEIHVIGVLGAGQMGGGIAQVARAGGLEVASPTPRSNSPRKGARKIDAILGKQVEKGKMSADVTRAIVSRITARRRPGRLRDCDLVIEAATESTDLKLKLFRSATRR